MYNAGGAGGGGRQRNIASMFASQANSQPSQLAQALALSALEQGGAGGNADLGNSQGQAPLASCGQPDGMSDDRPALIDCATTSGGIQVHR